MNLLHLLMVKQSLNELNSAVEYVINPRIRLQKIVL
nr:MAG TPA: hypothetical protein [Caudoviricetes sp.]